MKSLCGFMLSMLVGMSSSDCIANLPGFSDMTSTMRLVSSLGSVTNEPTMCAKLIAARKLPCCGVHRNTTRFTNGLGVKTSDRRNTSTVSGSDARSCSATPC